MQRLNIPSGSPMEKTIGFSRAVRVGNFISVAGTASIADDGSTAFPGDTYNQTRKCLEIMIRAIEEAGGSKSDVTRTRIYLKNAKDWEAAARAHGEIFSEIRPVCTFVEVKGFIDPSWLVETEAECILTN